MNIKGIHWAWVILAVCFIDLFLNYSIRLGYGVLLPEMIQGLHINRTQGGTIYNFFLATYICFTPFTGNLTDRLGARRVITIFSILLGGGTLLMGTCDSFASACVYFAIAGVGSSGIWTPVLTVIQKWFSDKRRGMALGILSTGYGLGFAIMGWIFPVLVASFSWRICWYMLGTFTLVMVLVNGKLLRSSPEDIGKEPWGGNISEGGEKIDEKSKKERKFIEIFRSPLFWTVGISYLFVAWALYLVTTFMVDYANLELGLSFKNASFLATIHGVSQIMGVLTIPVLSDKMGRKFTLTTTNLIVAASILGILISGRNILGLYASVAILGIAYGPTWPMYGACAGDYFKKEVMGTVIGAWTPLYGIGAILAHLTGGRIRDITHSFHWAFLLAVIFATLAAWIINRLPSIAIIRHNLEGR